MTDYKLLSFEHNGQVRAGLLVGDNIYDIAKLTGDERLSVLDAIVSDWVASEPVLQKLARQPTGQPIALADIRIVQPIARPGAVYCVGANYREHIDNMARKQGVDMGPRPEENGLPPFIFLKSANCVIGSGEPIIIDSKALDYEGELAAVIGRDASNVSVADALDYVAGYAVSNDMSARDRFVRGSIPSGIPFRFDWTGHKVFDGSCPIGPYLVPARFIPDPQSLWIKTWVNDEIRQDSTTADMLYSLAQILAYLSKLTTLRPGDIILTGTPAGVAAETGNFLKSGDIVRVEIEHLGAVENRILTSVPSLA